ncbi:hypothetical protein [Streptomyces rubradiris]|uniref:Uncharacterized protein n=1 Tax=Streptomyces rubradiris TaxID=285531 RepID=A0ABQ3RA69_STRRR|nr:hypothetical protein [Streptomyces rubradiris]GHH25824.1 hypothetical protein GCM10018792_65450 [Streptomyces rubradiris]GHI52750.1 hypothetical protein Srubr_25960 [Streptomyces rubradiris]
MTPSALPDPGLPGDEEFTPVYHPPAWYVHNPSPPDPAYQPPAWTTPAVQPAATAPSCTVCGVTPAAPVTVRAHQGFIVVMRWQRVTGPLCGLCGIALVREMSTKTLWQGWWGIGSLTIGAPFALLANLRAYRKLRRLQPAVPLHGTRQVPLGRPVLHRPLAYVALVPLIWAIVMLTYAITSTS